MSALKEKSSGPFNIKSEDITKANAASSQPRDAPKPSMSSLASAVDEPRKVEGAFSEEKKKKKKKPAKK